MTLTELTQPRYPAAALTASVAADGASTVVTLRGEADLFTLPVVSCMGPAVKTFLGMEPN